MTYSVKKRKSKQRYNKKDALEHIFKDKYNNEYPQQEIPFTRQEVRDAITSTDGIPPDNLNNFLKDLVRTGKSDPRSPSARKYGYYLREGSHSESMGIFFKPAKTSSKDIAITCPSDLDTINLTISLPDKILDLIRPDEGGLLSVLSYSSILVDFFNYLTVQDKTYVYSAKDKISIYTIQIPVKVQPHEIDGLFLLVNDDGKRAPIACEAKSQGNDSLMLNQIIGVTAAALDRIVENDMDFVIPLGAKLLKDGTIFLVSFEKCTRSDREKLNTIISISKVKKMAKYSISPIPIKWISKSNNSKKRVKTYS